MEGGIDYLTEDPVLATQKYVCLSILTAKSIKDNSGNSIESENHAKGIKVRGVYDSMEEAQKRCQQIRSFDPHFNVFVGEVGKWLPWDDDADKAEDAVYAEKKLNDIMRGYKEQQNKAKEYSEQRKQIEVERAIKIAQSNTSSSVDSNIVVTDAPNVPVKVDKVLTPEEIAQKEQRVAQISKELEEAKRLFDELKAAQK
jgi:hypothetical protein